MKKYLRKREAVIHYSLLVGRELYLILQALLMIFPLVYLIMCACKDYNAIIAKPFDLPNSFDTVKSNFESAWTGTVVSLGIPLKLYTSFLSMLKNTVIVVIVALVFLIVAATPMGYAMGTRNFKGKSALMMYIFFIQTVPLFGYLTSFYIMMNAMGFSNNLMAIGIIYAGVSMPGTILFMKGFYQSFPKEVEEAAEIDGANEFKRFMMIVVPMSKGIIVSMVLVQFMGYWNEFAIVNLLVSKPDLRTIAINVMMTANSKDVTYTFALLVLSALPTFIFFTIFQRRITQGGLALGSVKG